MRGLRKRSGCKVVVNLSSGDAIRGVLASATAAGVSVIEVVALPSERDVDGTVWVPVAAIVSVQVVA